MEEQPPIVEPLDLVPPEPRPGPEPSPFIVTMDELKQTQEAMTAKESEDLSKILVFVNPPPGDVKVKLLQWVSLGFPDSYMLYTVTLNPPALCLDGVSRTPFQYANYLLGMPISEKVRELQEKLPGMLLSYSTPGNSITIHVSKGNST